MTDKKPRPEDEIPARLMESAHQAWLAGLAVFETAQREGGRLFDTLVKEGQKPEARAGMEADPTQSVHPETPGVGAGAQERSNETLEKLERLFDDRLQRLLARLHLPTQEDILALERRIDELEREVETLRAAKTRRRASVKKTPDQPATEGPESDAKEPGTPL